MLSLKVTATAVPQTQTYEKIDRSSSFLQTILKLSGFYFYPIFFLLTRHVLFAIYQWCEASEFEYFDQK